jgi:hypothetical protein
MSIEISMMMAYNRYKAILARDIMTNLIKEREIKELKRETILSIKQMKAPTCDKRFRRSEIIQRIWDQDVELLKKKWTELLIKSKYLEIEDSHQESDRCEDENFLELKERLMMVFKDAAQNYKEEQVAKCAEKHLASRAIARAALERIYAREIMELTQLRIENGSP